MKSDAVTGSAVGTLHNKLVSNRRVEVLAKWFAELLPPNVRVLDVGCGDGLISAILQSRRPDLSVRGIDVLPRTQTHIPVQMFDGFHFPCESASFDVVLFSDVLHHTADPTVLLHEASRVAAHHVLIKDHYREGFAANARLRFMDWVGNARFGVALPYNYWTRKQWNAAWQEIGLQPERVVTTLGLYPKPADWVFGAKLHFIALLKRSGSKSGRAEFSPQFGASPTSTARLLYHRRSSEPSVSEPLRMESARVEFPSPLSFFHFSPVTLPGVVCPAHWRSLVSRG
jgi:SAM-dependent methyltransferase